MPRSEVSALVWFQHMQPVNEQVGAERSEDSVRITLRDGSVFFLKQPTIIGEAIVGEHDVLRTCTIPLNQGLKIQNGNGTWPSVANVDWKLEPTAEPQFVDDAFEQGTSSPLIGTDVREIVIPMLSGDPLRLGDEQDKIVVLDFWASWCAPCIRSLPKLIPLVSSFSDDQVKLIAVNQAEAPFTINTFLASRDLNLLVGLDTETALARQFGVTSIPQTIIIGTSGKVERVFVGAPANLHQSISQAIQELLPPSD